ncbi:transporter [Zalerion maritima]|uniref:Transporter n=1 Tax=Zalerion maritima TaxID=339359 RepID=A0AAD5RZC0_9PEZI|nr:transporter [Zalerion maritima]
MIFSGIIGLAASVSQYRNSGKDTPKTASEAMTKGWDQERTLPPRFYAKHNRLVDLDIRTSSTQNQKRNPTRQQTAPPKIKLPHGGPDSLSIPTMQSQIPGNRNPRNHEGDSEGNNLDPKLRSPPQVVRHSSPESSAHGGAKAVYHVDKKETMKTHSIGTKSLTMILPNVTTPPAPSPQTALAAMKLPMLCAAAHHTVAPENTASVTKYNGFLPTVSLSLPSKGWNAVLVKRKAVDNQEAEFDEWKYDVMTGWEDAIIVPSKHLVE